MNGTLRTAFNFLALGLVCSSFAAGCGGRGDREPQQSRLSGSAGGRNLILITIDTLRADRLGVNGHKVLGATPSPHIDGFLASGAHFANAIAPRAITWPSLATVLTGLYPSGHGVYENGYELGEGSLTLPMVLHAAGYQTGRFMSNMCSASAVGWESTYCSRSADKKINPEVFAWLDELEPDRPFFLWVHYFGAHGPYYNGGNRAQKRLDPGYRGPVQPRQGMLNRIMTEPIPLGEADLRHLDALYDAAVMGADRYAGELLTELSARDLLAGGVAVLLADHGEDLYDHNQYLYHACSVYQSGLHVPLGIVAPGILEPGTVVEAGVELADVAPTILDLLALEGSLAAHGSSLVPLLERPEAAGRVQPAFSEFPPSSMRTVQVGEWKLIDNPDSYWPFCLPGAPEDHYPIERVELYNLAADPLETQNLAAEYPQRVEEMQRLIEQHFAELPSNLTPQELPEELKKELEALGYVTN